ncbi:MAG: uroporphyrinogen-III synthase [Acidimicrobiia bacterium]
MTRVAITTDRFELAAPPYAALGLEPKPLPCIQVEPADTEVLTSARAAAAEADVILITSSRTVELLWPDRSMPAVDVAAVGKVTADAVAAAGGKVVATGNSGLAGLVETISDRPRARMVHPHAANSDPIAIERLRALAPTLEDYVVYRTMPIAPASTQVEAVAFASPSAVAGWLLTRDFEQLAVGVIGSTTGAAVARHRLPDVIASRPSHPALARALSSYLEVRV